MSTRAAHLRAIRGRGTVPSRGGERTRRGGRAGRCVADIAPQWEAFGYVPPANEEVVRFLRGARLASAAGSVAASAGAEQGQKEG